ncbi:MAG: NDP-sugar pyrophosphorylase family protein [Candidatus Nitrosomirales archaeon]|jgi:NDP-sugar pyrophosphorylase family protein
MTTTNWYDDQVARTQIVVMAGGKAKRMGIDIPKCMLEISGQKLIDMCIESLTKEGFRDFVFLLGHKHEMVTEHVGDGSKYGIAAKFSIDPASILGWGKGKAFKYALETNKIDKTKRSIVVFPDDLVLEEKVFSKFLMHHIEAIRKNAISASTLLVPGTEYPYGVAEVASDGTVLDFKEKPFLNKPTSVGVYLFEPIVYDIISKEISLEDPNPVDLESTIMPYLVTERRLTSLFIPSDKWVPINTMKEYEQAVKILSVQH